MLKRIASITITSGMKLTSSQDDSLSPSQHNECECQDLRFQAQANAHVEGSWHLAKHIVFVTAVNVSAMPSAERDVGMSAAPQRELCAAS